MGDDVVVGEWVYVGVAVGKAVSVCMAATKAWVSICMGGGLRQRPWAPAAAQRGGGKPPALLQFPAGQRL